MHAFAAAIDVNDKQADYWVLKGAAASSPGATGAGRHRRDFERHGFIWGAKWFHVDSMHFEYRPELIALAKQAGPRSSADVIGAD